MTSRHWQKWLATVFRDLLLPLFPLVIDKVIIGHIDPRTLTLVTTMYALYVGVSAKNELLRILGHLIGYIYACVYGAISYQLRQSAPSPAGIPQGLLDATSTSIAWGVLILLFSLGALERYFIIRQSPPDDTTEGQIA